jgi:hypothetical protein
MSHNLISLILEDLVDGALSGQVLLMIYSYRTRRADSEYIYSSRSKRSSQGQNITRNTKKIKYKKINIITSMGRVG